MPTLPVVTARRYVQPLREGGSLPAVVDTAEGLWVTKFRGAGQGPKALVAEIVVGVLARELGLPVPELALVEVTPGFGTGEPDPEIQDVLRGSHGLNVGLRYLDGAFNFDARAAGDLITDQMAADLVWLDALVTNPDRTARNPNLLVWRRQPWLIDHGAALYAHHAWSRVGTGKARNAFPLIRDHILLTRSGDLHEADARLAPQLTVELLEAVTAAVPDELLEATLERDGFADAGESRARYVRYLADRMAAPRAWLEEAVRARELRRAQPPLRLSSRR